MKSILILLFMLMLTPLLAQDTIYTTTNQVINCKVIEVGIDSTSFEIDKGGSTFLKRSSNVEITRIHLSNGTYIILAKDQLQQQEVTKGAGIGLIEESTRLNSFQQGQVDAIKYYKNYTVAGTATAAITVLNPLAGLVLATATSTTKPSLKNLGMPQEELKSQPDYLAGYMSEAKKTKSSKVWKNFGMVLGVQVALLTVFILSASSN